MNNQGTLLWVDDEIELLHAHILFLRNKGYVVDTVSNGTDAVEACRKNVYDLVLLDENMVGMSGLQTLAMLKDADPNGDLDKLYDSVVKEEKKAERKKEEKEIECPDTNLFLKNLKNEASMHSKGVSGIIDRKPDIQAPPTTQSQEDKFKSLARLGKAGVSRGNLIQSNDNDFKNYGSNVRISS